MIEVERKYRLTPAQYEAVLDRLSLNPETRVQQEDSVFLTAMSFQTMAPGSPVMRIRKSGGDATLTLKRRREARSSVEFETGVENPEQTRQILLELGLHRVTNVSKSRLSVQVGQVVVALDDVTGLGYFVELEVVVEDQAAVEGALRMVQEVATSLGLDEDSRELRKYDELLTEANEDPGPELEQARPVVELEHFATQLEIERRFLLQDGSITAGAAWEEITQAYVFSLDGFAIRVRRVRRIGADGKLDQGTAWITGKGPRIGSAREEYDMEIATDWAHQIIIRSANVVRKRRFQVVTDQTWEIDQFLDENEGLWIAELEGGDEIKQVRRPAWTLREILNEPEYNNEELSTRPFKSWLK